MQFLALRKKKKKGFMEMVVAPAAGKSLPGGNGSFGFLVLLPGGAGGTGLPSLSVWGLVSGGCRVGGGGGRLLCCSLLLGVQGSVPPPPRFGGRGGEPQSGVGAPVRRGAALPLT